jgi:cytochrome c oxidase subunit 2
MSIFVWATDVYFKQYRMPKDALEVYVVGKQWMWKIQHTTGQREINELHVPIGRPVKLIMGSEDVLHSYYIPAFRVKADVIPGRYNTMWFEATRAGTYHLFCAEYCGTKHSGMIGSIIAMEPADYQTWLAGGPAEDSPVAAGEKLFQSQGCASCHQAGPTQRGPSLAGILGHEVKLQGGGTATVDDAYLRESIVLPQAKIVEGFAPIMPTFQGLLSEEQLLQLIAYVKSLKPAEGAAAPQQK